MDAPDFRPAEMPMRLEEHLSFPDLISYLIAREGQERLVAVTLAAEQPASILGRHTLAVGGALGALAEAEVLGSATRVMRLPVGPNAELLLDEEQFRGAARLSMGPEVEALVIELADVRVLVQDILTAPE